MTEPGILPMKAPKRRSRPHVRRVIAVWIILLAFLVVAIASMAAVSAFFPCACGTTTTPAAATALSVGEIA
jgi:flagellar basal body-associated protein FliL